MFCSDDSMQILPKLAWIITLQSRPNVITLQSRAELLKAWLALTIG